MQKIPFSSIKVIKNKVVIGLKSIEDTENNRFAIGPIESDKPATQEMQFALQYYQNTVAERLFDLEWLVETIKIQSMVPEIKNRYLSRITIQGVTVDDRDGFVGLKIHYRIDNPTFFKSQLNAHLPFIYESANDWDDLEEEERKGFLSPTDIENLKVLFDETKRYLQVTPKDYKDLPLFNYAPALPEADTAEDEHLEAAYEERADTEDLGDDLPFDEAADQDIDNEFEEDSELEDDLF